MVTHGNSLYYPDNKDEAASFLAGNAAGSALHGFQTFSSLSLNSLEF